MPQIPASMPLGAPIIAIPSTVYDPPKEGMKSVPFQITWSRPIARSLDTVSVNLQGNSTLEFSQICGLIVDNSNCGASLDFIFIDSDVTISIPAYAPYTVVQVNSRALEFYVRAIGPIATDVTSFSVLNYAPAPVAVPVTVEQQTAALSSISANVAATTAIVPAGVNGTLQDFAISFGIAVPAAASNAIGTLTDGTGRVIARVPAYVNTGQSVNQVLLDMTDLAVRFTNGINFTVSGLLIPTGEFAVNLYYRLP